MSMKIRSLNAVSFVAGFATCALVGAAVLASPQWQAAEPAAAAVLQAQVAKYQPGTGEGGAQVRRARNEALGQGTGGAELVQPCPRCR